MREPVPFAGASRYILRAQRDRYKEERDALMKAGYAIRREFSGHHYLDEKGKALDQLIEAMDAVGR